jgi:hypothetical protein
MLNDVMSKPRLLNHYLYTFSNLLYENPSLIIVSAETEYFTTRSWHRNINFSRDRIRRIFLHGLLSSLQNDLAKRSSSYTIWFQMRCWMTSCLNRYYLILIFIHFPIYFMKSIVYYRLCWDRIFFDKILVSEYKLFKRSNKANLFIALVQ